MDFVLGEDVIYLILFQSFVVVICLFFSQFPQMSLLKEKKSAEWPHA